MRELLNRIRSVDFRGKKVQNPTVAVILVLGTISIVVCSLPIILPASYLLRRLGRKGFFVPTSNGKIDIILTREAFDKQAVENVSSK